MIKDSGERREFDSGAVRDIQEGKGRCDLLPLDVVADVYSVYSTDDSMHVFNPIAKFQQDGTASSLILALGEFLDSSKWQGFADMLLEVSKHFEEGNKKYPPSEDGTPNWQLGIPVSSYIDSAIRHYLKWLRGDNDEPHDRAFVWNILCCIWTCKHKPELNDYLKGGD